MTDSLHNRLRRHWRSTSGVVHDAYECNRVMVDDGTCLTGFHPFCAHDFPGQLSDGPTTCKRCLKGGSAWIALLQSALHPEIAPALGGTMAGHESSSDDR